MTTPATRNSAARHFWRPLALLVSLLQTTCFVVYHPLASLQRPVAVDPRLPNLEGLHIQVLCPRGDFLDQDEADELCRLVGRLFATQGAIIRVPGGLDSEFDEAPEATASDPIDLSVQFESQLLHKERNTLLWALSFGTLTLLPAITEYTFAQDVRIRDGRGFLLVSDRLQGRFVRYFGAGISSVTWLLDLFVREEHERFTRSAVERDFTRDFYGQVSQLAFNASTRLAVLKQLDRGAATATE